MDRGILLCLLCGQLRRPRGKHGRKGIEGIGAQSRINTDTGCQQAGFRVRAYLHHAGGEDALSMAMVEINRKVMEATDGLEDFDPDDKDTAALMERQMSAMSSLRRLMDFSGPLDGSPQPFSGWKVKVDFEGVDADGQGYHSEYWFILDKEAQCVVKSFEIPLP